MSLHNFVAKEDRSEVAALFRVERFWSYVETTTDPLACWTWRGLLDGKGYGLFPDGGRTSFAHRVAYELAYGEIAGDLTIDHVCHSLSDDCPGGDVCLHRRCVRPSHLEPVERGENTRRAIRLIAEAARRRAGRQTHCKHGHELTPDNVAFKKNGARRCRACHREQVRRARLKKAGEAS